MFSFDDVIMRALMYYVEVCIGHARYDYFTGIGMENHTIYTVSI